MNRKTFVFTAGLGGAALLTNWWISSCAPDERELLLAIPESLLPICEPDGIMEIGKAYLHQTPGENKKQSLVKMLTANFSGASNTLDTHIELNIIDEFHRGDIVELSGWLVSRTEARQCALYSLLNS